MAGHWHEDDLARLTPEFVRAYCEQVPGYVDERDDFGDTPLVAACLRGHTAIARVLLAAGADPNFDAGDGASALKAAIPEHGEPFDRELFDLLFAAGADPNRGSEPPLHRAAGLGLAELVAYLLEHGADPDLEDVDEDRPLDWALGYGHGRKTAVIRVLVAHGADTTRLNRLGTQTLADQIGPELMRDAPRQGKHRRGTPGPPGRR